MEEGVQVKGRTKMVGGEEKGSKWDGGREDRRGLRRGEGEERRREEKERKTEGAGNGKEEPR